MKFTLKASLLGKLLLAAAMMIGGGSSAWADDPYVNTLTFENSEMPSGWSDKSGNPNYVVYSGDYITTNGNYTLVKLTSSEKINLVSGQKIVIVAQTTQSSTGNYYGIRYQHGSDFSTFSTSTGTLYDGTSNFPSTGTDCTIIIDIDDNQNEYIAFWFYGRVKIKSIDFQAAGGGSGIPKPTGFSSSVTAYSSVDLSWTAGGEETEWQIKYSTTEDFDPDAAGTLVDHDVITTNSYTLSGLSGGTTYYAYVRAYIDEETQSDWTGPLSFTTYEQYPTPTDLTASNYAGAGTEATISWIDGDGDTPTSWQLKYSSSDFDPENEEDPINIDGRTKTLTGLTSGETYYVAVRAYYGGENYSSWADKISFTTIAAWETFDDGIPDTWYNKDNHWRTDREGYEGKASATSSSYELRSPRIYMVKDETVSFDLTVTSSLNLKYFKDNRSGNATHYANYTESGEKTFTAPSTGYYWLQFTGYNCAIDNLSGVGPVATEHLLGASITTMTSSGTVGGDYTATVTVHELGGVDETFTVQLYYDDEIVAEKTNQELNANRDVSVSLTFTPTEAKASKHMYFKIIYNGGASDTETGWRSVTMSNTTYELDEDDSSKTPGSSSGMYSQVLKMKYTAKDGWNTICVPFQLTDTHLEQLFGVNYKIYKLNSYSDGVLSFEDASSLAVSTPYLVYAEDVSGVDASNILLKAVTITTSNWNSTNKEQTKGDATFQGTYVRKDFVENDDWYGVTPSGRIMKAGTGAFVRGYRAYFTGVSAPSPGAEVKMFIIGGDDIPTDVGFVKMVDADAKEVYNLAGQRIQKARKGIYIVNGKKVVIK